VGRKTITQLLQVLLIILITEMCCVKQIAGERE